MGGLRRPFSICYLKVLYVFMFLLFSSRLEQRMNTYQLLSRNCSIKGYRFSRQTNSCKASTQIRPTPAQLSYLYVRSVILTEWHNQKWPQLKAQAELESVDSIVRLKAILCTKGQERDTRSSYKAATERGQPCYSTVLKLQLRYRFICVKSTPPSIREGRKVLS